MRIAYLAQHMETNDEKANAQPSFVVKVLLKVKSLDGTHLSRAIDMTMD